MSVGYRDSIDGSELAPSGYAAGRYRIMLGLGSNQDFRMFAEIAHSTRLTRDVSKEKSMIEFKDLEEI